MIHFIGIVMLIAIFGIIIAFVGMIIKINIIDETDTSQYQRSKEINKKVMEDAIKKVRIENNAAYLARKQKINEASNFEKILSIDSNAAKGSFTNSIGMKFNFIPSGEFVMGSQCFEEHRGYGEAQHKVLLTHGFYIGIYQVTQVQYKAVMQCNPSRFLGNNNPVEQVSWEDATSFCKKLSEKEGIEYSLPTEAQWEYACRAGTSTAYCWGNKWLKGVCNAENDEGTTEDSNCKIFRKRGLTVGGTTPVGSFQSNPFGLYDMIGNVWEWCSDSFDLELFKRGMGSQVIEDPFNWSVKEDSHVLRGGSWSDGPWYCRSACLFYYVPDGKYKYDIGFRVLIPVSSSIQISKPNKSVHFAGVIHHKVDKTEKTNTIDYKVDKIIFKNHINNNNIRCLFHFTDKTNLPYIIKYGGLFSWEALKAKNVTIPMPGGNDISRSLDLKKHLSNYVRLCFTKNHPMRSFAENDGRIKSCIYLEIDPIVIYWLNTKFSNINATDNDAKIGDSFYDYNKMNFQLIKKNHWRDENEKKEIQAEVLVLKHIPLKYILNINEFYNDSSNYECDGIPF